MTQDIFEFWSEIGPSEKIHPRDRDVLGRVTHSFDLRCLPGCFFGPLLTARIVLLYLNPGLSQADLHEADDPKAQARYADCRKGRQLITDDRPGFKWWSSRTKVFGGWEEIRDKIAVLNIAPYHSKAFSDWALLGALPSCRATVDWAQSYLFPEAEQGKRVVVCMRSAQHWGLGVGRHGEKLFVPPAARSGHMLRSALRDEVISAAKEAIAR
jgi:hypothetical protein